MPKSKTACKPEFAGALRLVRDLRERELKDARHARDRSCALRQLLADEKRQNEIVRAELCLADEISQRRRCGASGADDEPIFSPAEAKRCVRGSQARRMDESVRLADLTRSSVPVAPDGQDSLHDAAGTATDYLLIDISNSYTKLAFATREAASRSRSRHPTKQLTVGCPATESCEAEACGPIVVSSVVPRKNQVIAAAAGSARVLFLSAETRSRRGG